MQLIRWLLRACWTVRTAQGTYTHFIYIYILSELHASADCHSLGTNEGLTATMPAKSHETGAQGIWAGIAVLHDFKCSENLPGPVQRCSDTSKETHRPFHSPSRTRLIGGELKEPTSDTSPEPAAEWTKRRQYNTNDSRTPNRRAMTYHLRARCTRYRRSKPLSRKHIILGSCLFLQHGTT